LYKSALLIVKRFTVIADVEEKLNRCDFFCGTIRRTLGKRERKVTVKAVTQGNCRPLTFTWL